MAIHRFVQRLDPRLSDILNGLEGSAIGVAFKDRALELASSAGFAEAVDHSSALAAHLWVLERAAAEQLTLTAAGYLKPADVKDFADVLPTMHDWIFRVTTEIHTQPVLYFRESLRRAGLLRRHKGQLLATKRGRAGLADHAALWADVAHTLIPASSDFEETAAVIILVHASTSDGRIDMESVASATTQLGWSYAGREPLSQSDVYPIWNDLWAGLGNVGPYVEQKFSERRLSQDAIALVRDALFTRMASPTE